MPFYDFENINTGEIHSVFFKMNDEKIYNGEKGDEINLWRRIYSVPLAAVSTRLDPHSEAQFRDSTLYKKETYGSMWERSKELAQKRTEKEGIDPVHQKHLADYKKSTGVDNIRQSLKDTSSETSKIISSAIKKLS